MSSDIPYKPIPGTHISQACEEAVAIANCHSALVSFAFNGTAVSVVPGDSPHDVEGRWSAEFKRKAEAYRNSPEGKAAAADAEWRRQDHQRRTDALMQRLSESVKGIRELVIWCAEMSDAVDHVGVIWDRNSAIATIEAAGYVANVHVGRPREDFDDRRVCDEWIIGQALDCMKKGLPPHPITQKFARESVGWS